MSRLKLSGVSKRYGDFFAVDSINLELQSGEFVSLLGPSGIPALVYTDGAFQKKFKPNEIVSEDTGLGGMVSVALILTTDAGGERFGFFLPLIDVARGQTAHFHTVGIYETFSGPNSVPHRPSTWRCIEMTGTAQSVIVPL